MISAETFTTLSVLLNGLLLGYLFDRFVNPNGHPTGGSRP